MNQNYNGVTDGQLLTRLDRERQKFTQANDALMAEMIQVLIDRGVYPEQTVEGNPNSIATMVQCWGAGWYRWSGMQTCPHCQADLRCHRTGPPFGRKIGLYSNDETRSYRCPDCAGEWSREQDDAEGRT